MEVCGGDTVKDWEGLGKALSIPEGKLEELALTHKNDVEKCKEHMFKVLVVGGVKWLDRSGDCRGCRFG